jgi:hypothetical protein
MPRIWVARAFGLALIAGFAVSLGACDKTDEPQQTAQEPKSEGREGVTQYDTGTTTTFEPAAER